MVSGIKNLSDQDLITVPSPETITLGMVVSAYYEEITYALRDDCKRIWRDHKIPEQNIYLIEVPGSFELLSGADLLIRKYPDLDAVVCLGCVIKGETDHDKYINLALAQGFQNLSMQYHIPIQFGVLTPNTAQQARDRAGGIHGNKGSEAAMAALKMAMLKQNLNPTS